MSAMQYETKDSGERARFDSGMQRDLETGKPRFDLMIPKDVPYEWQMITRLAALYGRGAEKYDARNWEQAAGEEELERFYSSAFRHFMQWFCGETDEDHASATIFNLIGAETLKYKQSKEKQEPCDECEEAPVEGDPAVDEWREALQSIAALREVAERLQQPILLQNQINKSFNNQEGRAAA